MDDSQRKLVAEFFGTFALIFFGAGVGAAGRRRGRSGARQRPRDRRDGEGRRAHLGRALQPGRDALDARHPAHRIAEAVRYRVAQLAGGRRLQRSCCTRPIPTTEPQTSASPAVGGPTSAPATRSWPRSARSSSSSSSMRSRWTSAVVQHPRRPAHRPHDPHGRPRVGGSPAPRSTRRAGSARLWSAGTWDDSDLDRRARVGAVLAALSYDQVLLRGTQGRAQTPTDSVWWTAVPFHHTVQRQGAVA